MQGSPTSTEDDEPSIPTESVRDDPNMDRTAKERRKAAKHTLPFGMRDLELPEEDIPARKKRLLEKPLPETADEGDAGAPRRWTSEEYEKLAWAVAHTSKKKRGKKYEINWVAISALVPGRTRKQCCHRWDAVFDPSNGGESISKGRWTAVENSQLKDAVHTYGGKDWAAIAALVPSRTLKQCWKRWNESLDHRIDLTGGSTGRWTAVEDSKLKDAVKTHGDKDWAAVSAMVPGRTKNQCNQRWHNAFNPSIALTAGRAGVWEEGEDSKLKEAVETHGDKDWGVVSAMVPGRTRLQCRHRWQFVLEPSNGRASGRTKWTAVEDSKLKDAVQTHGDEDWGAVSALVPDRTRKQCRQRWHNTLNPSIDRANEQKGTWTAAEDSKLKDAVHTHGGKDWGAIAAMVPGRTSKQCNQRWHKSFNHSIGQASWRNGIWTEDEDSKLKDAVQMHGEDNWAAVSAMVPGRTKRLCNNRWHNAFHSSIALTGESKGKWTAVEDSKLMDAVQTHGDKDWAAVSAKVPGRSRMQCRGKWHLGLDPSTIGSKGKWTAVEESNLKDAVETHGDKNWCVIAALVPGRNRKQCSRRWRDALDPRIALASGRKGIKWTVDEDSMLKDAVHTHGAKDWGAIATLVPGRTFKQCHNRWKWLDIRVNG